MPQANEIIHQTVRLKVMAALTAADEPLEFKRLQAITKATGGNLSGHLATMEKAGYVSVEKDFVGKKPRSRFTATALGRRAFQDHLDYLRDTLAGL